MSIQIQYQKSHVIQGLRYHFIKQSEIKGLMLFVNVYAIITAVLLFYKKIRPELFLVGSLLWIVLMVFFWFCVGRVGGVGLDPPPQAHLLPTQSLGADRRVLERRRRAHSPSRSESK